WLSWGMRPIAMFPLGSVLFPHMPLPLRVFEPRYLAMLADILKDEPSEFGVVLIERGQEVGGGDVRVATGTLARVSDLDTADEAVLMIAQGAARFEVREWLDDDPYPKALVQELPEPEWDPALQPVLADAEALVRRVLKRLADEELSPWPADVGLDEDPAAAAWQLAAIAPLNALDQVELLRSDSYERLLTRLVDLVTAVDETY
ncbi:MAG TPA: LON peptidase substrate-binding domain-containing protein, partial [Amnibacterium sp.]|nr:LON peptidase substrate-binding domain-containing protein [Amnibacterium sp.]